MTRLFTYQIPQALSRSIFPPIVLKLTGNSRLAPHSNCWNSTLLFHGVSVPREWTSGHDMNDWIKANTKRIEDRANLRRGDILYIFGSGMYYISHTAVYVGKGWYWHKDGSGIAEFARLERVLENYSCDQWHHRRLLKSNNYRVMSNEASGEAA